MSKGRTAGSRRTTRIRSGLEQNPPRPSQKFLGLSLGGGKQDRTCLCAIEYYLDPKKLFVTRIFDRISSEIPSQTGDQKLFQLISQYELDCQSMAIDVPKTLPKCIRCNLICPGIEFCQESEIVWLRRHYEKRNSQKRPQRSFTPYTQRCTETWIAENFTQFEMQHALGANLAPLTARAHFLLRRLNVPTLEVYPVLSFIRIGEELKIKKARLRQYKNIAAFEELRREFLTELIVQTDLFLYDQDFKLLVESPSAFFAFLCAFTAFLHSLRRTVSRPSDFPTDETFACVPLPSTGLLRKW